MEENTLMLKNGIIKFDDDRILIKDKAKREFWMWGAISIFWIAFGVMSIREYFAEGSSFDLWIGIILSTIYLLNIVTILLRSYKKEILISEILGLEIKQKLGGKILKIKLRNNKTRIVRNVNSIYDELKGYVEKVQYQLKT